VIFIVIGRNIVNYAIDIKIWCEIFWISKYRKLIQFMKFWEINFIGKFSF